jgi:hypothetical protein
VVNRQARNGSAPSDQPVVVDLDEASDRDIGPVVLPGGSFTLPQAP